MKVVLIEDNPEIVNGVSLTFKLRWPDAIVMSCGDGEKGLMLVEKESPEIVILDINLPDMTGFEVLEAIRAFSDVPIVVLTVRNDEVDELRGLELGADDYIVKPFSPANLLTRVRAVLRRSGINYSDGRESLPPLVGGKIKVDLSKGEISVNGTVVHLTPNERKIFYCLARNEGKLVTLESLRKQVWGSEARYIDNSAIKRYIYELRSKLGDDAQHPQLIQNERGLGYRLVKS